ncbi:enoyl-CoA hydratase [Bacillus sp. M6-12]|uniref:enoyl-CoA hydratase/isomerase family protein n=1 Tax=Bacillus sp. M6-12 TaxID=2054166 RepID=UPI000C76E8C9|nr:enoyl-CoA hydratase/isomerase family protein [Bacillus sp. M6-12]PLS18564.1 enoyl-CoA hydratase [Bacillus sp. M6-12]
MSTISKQDSILTKIDGNIAIVELNRPPANALDIPTTLEIQQVVDQLLDQNEVKVIILRSANPKIFCGGADIATVESHDVDGMDKLGKVIKDLTLSMRGSSKIFIAEIAGHCLGGGLELALSCDFRIASNGTQKFGLPERNLGLFPGGGGIQLVGRLVGQQTAFHLAVTGELIDVTKAQELGLIDQVHQAEELREKTLEYAAKIAKGPSVAISNMKQSIYRGLSMGIEEAFDFERQMHKHLVVTEDCYEGVNAYKEKRQANFKGK